MPDSITFNARAVFTFSPDRIYRVESRNGCLYFLRIGGQFDRDRLGPPAGGGLLPAVMMLAAGRKGSGAAFGGAPRARMVYQDAAHQLGGDAEELAAIAPVRASLIHEPEVSLVHERSALQSVIRALAAEITPGLAAQFVIDQGHQGVKRLVIAVSPNLRAAVLPGWTEECSH